MGRAGRPPPREKEDDLASTSFTVAPADAEAKLITWSSSDEAVARVDANGTVSLQSTGIATIFAKLDSGKAFSYELTVHESGYPLNMQLESLSVLNPELSLKVGEYGQLRVDGEPKPFGPNACVPRFTSSDESVATVDDNGVVKALKSGTARIAIEERFASQPITTAATVTVTDPAATTDKNANPVVVEPKAKSLKAKASKLKKKAVTIKKGKAFKVTNAQGTLTFKRGAVKCKKKLLKQAKKKIKVAKNGTITLKKGLKKGTYKVAVKVTAAGNASYDEATRTVTLKIIVK